MTDDPKHSVMLVDDEPRILSGLARQLRGHFRLYQATSGREALEVLEREGPVTVLLTDMRMPVMDGATLCSLVRARWPDTVRVVLSGQSDFEASLKAVNQGRIFRFLTKPISHDALLETLEEAAAAFDRSRTEKRILEETFHGAVDALGEVLALGNPEVFGRGSRLRAMVGDFCRHHGVENPWEVEVAAVFSQIGWVTLPPEVVRKLDEGSELAPGEQAMVAELMQFPERILSRIPRLEGVREIIRYCQKDYDGNGRPEGPGGEHIPWGARVLRLVGDLARLESQGHRLDRAVQILSHREGCYDPALVQALGSYLGDLEAGEDVRELRVSDLRVGYRLVEPVLSSKGVLLVARGQSVTEQIISRLENFRKGIGLREPLVVAIPHEAGQSPLATGTEGE